MTNTWMSVHNIFKITELITRHQNDTYYFHGAIWHSSNHKHLVKCRPN